MADEDAGAQPAGPPPRAAIGTVPLPPGYVLVEKLGSGGFATVWLAEQGRLGRRVAVKLLGETLEDSERERRFLAECRAIGRLSGHPAVVTVHDAGTTDDGHPYLVMEHMPGGSLHDRLRSGPLPWTEVLDIGVHVADALAAAHDAGILHRDIKPANVLLDENGSPKLGDFGIARLSEGVNTATGVLVGTIPFTPPEVLSGHRPEATADVWALGATLHALLAGTSPFGGYRDEPPAASIARVLRGEAPPLGPEVPAALRDLIAGMLRPEPSDRPAGAPAVVARLQAIQAERGLPVTPARATRVAAPSAPIGLSDATAVGLPAIDTSTPPPPPGGVADLAKGPPPPPPTPPPVSGPDPSAATVAGVAAIDPDEVRADAPTTAGPSVAAAAATDGRVTSETPPPASPPTAHSAGATSVLPAHQPAGATPGPPPPGPAPGYAGAPPGSAPSYPPPPPPSASGRGKGPVVIGIGALVVLLLVAAVAAVLVLGGGEDDPDGGGAAAGGTAEPGDDAASDDTGSSADDPTLVDTLVGASLVVPTGLSASPGGAVDIAAGCADNGCSIASEGGGAVLVEPTSATGARVTHYDDAAGNVGWTYDIEGISGRAGLALLGDLVIVSATVDGVRSYRAINEGALRWTVEVGQDDGPVFPNPQVSDRYAVMILGNVGRYRVISLADGQFEEAEGRVLATDRTNVYVATGDQVVARNLETGAEAWVAEGVVSAAPPEGTFPSWRYGVVVDSVFVTATEEEVVGIGTEGGAVVWRVPISADDVTLGSPFGMSAVGSVVVVTAELGDLGIDTATRKPRWRTARDRIVLTPEHDDARLSEVQGTPVWVGTGDSLVAGHTGVGIQQVDLSDGSVASATTLEPTGGRSSVTYAQSGLTILQAGRVSTYGYADVGAPIWESADYPEARGLAAVTGGVAVLDPAGVHILVP